MREKLVSFPGNTKTGIIKSPINNINGKIIPFIGTKEAFNKKLKEGVTILPYKGYFIYVVHKENEYLILSCLSRDILASLISFGNEAMSSTIIAEYLMDREDFSELLATIEWSHNPERRRQELSERTNLGFNCINLRLYKDNEVESFVKKIKKAS